MGDTDDTITDTATIGTLRALLESPARRNRFPEPLESEFHAHMLDEGLRLTRESWWALLLVAPAGFILLRTLTALLSTPQHLADNLAIFNLAMAGEGLVVLMIAFTPWLPRVRQLYPFYALCTSGGAIACVGIATSAFPDPYLNILAAFTTSIVILLVYALGVVSVRLATLAGLGGVLVTWVVVRTQDLWYEPGYFIAYAIMPNVVGMLVSKLISVRDRASFLKSRLLAAEKVLVDRYAAEVERLSRHDALTGLANRRHFNEALAREWNLARRQRQPVSLLFIDVDYFKPFNDRYGHQEGDRVLSRIGSALASCTRRPADVAARYGGEEFVLLLPGTTTEGAREMAERVTATVRELAIPHDASKTAPHVTVSIGMATTVPEADDGSAQLLSAADAAVYAAKEAGRNCIVPASR